MKYRKIDVYNYMIGNDIDNIEELETDSDFIFEVLKLSKDKAYYYYLPKYYQNKYEVIKFIIDNFKDDFNFLKEVVNSYISKKITNKQDEIHYKEITILMASLDKDELSGYKAIRNAFYEEDKIKIYMINEEQNIGLGFIYIKDNYDDNEVICKYYAEAFLYELFYQNKVFEELIHKEIKNFNELNRVGNITFLLNYIGRYDSSLKEYVENNIDLLENISHNLDLVKMNWTNYMDRLNQNRKDIIFYKIKEFMDEYQGKFYFNCYLELDKILENLNISNIFQDDEVKQISVEYNKECDELLLNKFRKDITVLIKSLFKEDIIPVDESDYNNKEGKIYKKQS